MTLRNYLENKGFDEIASLTLASDITSVKSFHTVAMKAFTLGEIEGHLAGHYNGDYATRKAIRNWYWKKLTALC